MEEQNEKIRDWKTKTCTEKVPSSGYIILVYIYFCLSLLLRDVFISLVFSCWSPSSLERLFLMKLGRHCFSKQLAKTLMSHLIYPTFPLVFLVNSSTFQKVCPKSFWSNFLKRESKSWRERMTLCFISQWEIKNRRLCFHSLVNNTLIGYQKLFNTKENSMLPLVVVLTWVAS